MGQGIVRPIPLQPTEEDDGKVADLTDKGVSMLHAFCENAAGQLGLVVEDVEKRFEVKSTIRTVERYSTKGW